MGLLKSSLACLFLCSKLGEGVSKRGDVGCTTLYGLKCCGCLNVHWVENINRLGLERRLES